MRFVRLVFLFLAFFTNGAYAVPTFQEVVKLYRASDAKFLDKNGHLLQEKRIDKKGRSFDWMPLSEVSKELIRGLVYAEDRRFYEHSGVDFHALAKAAFDTYFLRRPRGGSTIAMQLVGILDPSLKPTRKNRSLIQKMYQIRAARELVRSWKRSEILEAYLNLISFRGELIGLPAASRGIFGKAPSGLNRREIALLIALLRGPNADATSVARRACHLEKFLNPSENCLDLKSFVVLSLGNRNPIHSRVNEAPHVANRLVSSLSDDVRLIRTTLDLPLQRFVRERLKNHIGQLADRNMNDGAALVVENETGNVLAYVGNAGLNPQAEHVDGIRALRQAGSTLKPILYLLAIEGKWITSASLLDDSPVDLPQFHGSYRPSNYDNRFAGLVTARTALAASLNIPAVRVAELLGPERMIERMRRLGFSHLNEGEFYGPSIALGSADVSLWDLVQAYRTMATLGQFLPLRFQESEQRKKVRLLGAAAAYIVSNILSDREARSVTFGLENPLATRFWTAVKTGTSKDMRDNWCIGFSSKYTVGVWAGNFSGKPMFQVTGVSGAAPVWVDVMNYLHRRIPSSAPKIPKGVVITDIDGKPEYFLLGTEPQSARKILTREETFPKILYPKSGLIVAWDPDIPPGRQKLFFEIAGGDGMKLVVDETESFSVSRLPSWTPTRGRHIAKLVDGIGKTVDEVTFEVR